MVYSIVVLDVTDFKILVRKCLIVLELMHQFHALPRGGEKAIIIKTRNPVQTNGNNKLKP
jgi:hypothetical protein